MSATDERGVDVKDCENLLWQFIGALDVADATDADKKPIVSDYARRIVATLGDECEIETYHRCKCCGFAFEVMNVCPNCGKW